MSTKTARVLSGCQCMSCRAHHCLSVQGVEREIDVMWNAGFSLHFFFCYHCLIISWVYNRIIAVVCPSTPSSTMLETESPC